MGYYYRILGSSSSGNCSLLKTEHSTVLIDAGFSGKRICEMLEDAGQRIENVDAVFVTHEHSDHATGLKGLARHGHDLARWPGWWREGLSMYPNFGSSVFGCTGIDLCK